MSRVIGEEIVSGGESVRILIEVEEEAWEGHVSFATPGGRAKTRGMRDSTADTVPSGVTNAFSKGMQLIRACAEQVSDTVRQVSRTARPQEVEVKFGVKLSAETGAFIAKTGTEAHMEVTLKWAGEVA